MAQYCHHHHHHHRLAGLVSTNKVLEHQILQLDKSNKNLRIKMFYKKFLETCLCLCFADGFCDSIPSSVGHMVSRQLGHSNAESIVEL